MDSLLHQVNSPHKVWDRDIFLEDTRVRGTLSNTTYLIPILNLAKSSFNQQTLIELYSQATPSLSEFILPVKLMFINYQLVSKSLWQPIVAHLPWSWKIILLLTNNWLTRLYLINLYPCLF